MEHNFIIIATVRNKRLDKSQFTADELQDTAKDALQFLSLDIVDVKVIATAERTPMGKGPDPQSSWHPLKNIFRRQP